MDADTFVYDGNGNGSPTTYKGTGITFDANSKPTASGSLVTAGYGIDGMRAWKQDSTTGNRTYFLYDGMTPVVEISSAGTILATNTFGADGLVSRNTTSTGASDGVGTSGSVFYVFDDHGNTTGRYAPGAGTQQLDFHLYDAWGGTVPTPASDGTPSTVDPWDGPGAKYGGYIDHETGLTLHGFRYYDPSRGRWVNRDPIGVAGGLNIYACLLNDPTSHIDPLGLDGFASFASFLWQGPQNIVGFIASIGGTPAQYDANHDAVIMQGSWLANLTHNDITLGNYIITPSGPINQCIISHELDHRDQSAYLGPLYLPLVALGYILPGATGDAIAQSAQDGNLYGDLHDANPFEIDADQRATCTWCMYHNPFTVKPGPPPYP